VSLWLGVLCIAASAASGPPRVAQDHGYTPADIENGGRLYQAACSGCHGPAGDAIPGVELARGEFRRATSDTDLVRIIQSGIPNTTMPPHSFSDRDAAQVVAYLRNMSAIGAGSGTATLRGAGDPARGRTIFEGKGGCTTCHRVYGRGPRVAPDLSEVGATRSLPELHEALLDPDARVRPGNRLFQVLTRSGSRITGRLLNQDSFSVQILDASERLVSLQKSDLREYGFIRASTMPSYREMLTTQELDDLVGYLVTLKGLNP